MLEKLKNSVFKANIDLVSKGLVIHTWGNVSGLDKESGLIVIKPSGVSYETMIPGDLVVIDQQGKTVEGHYKPSTDAPTHILLYKTYKEIGGVVHTHSSYATSWAQAGSPYHRSGLLMQIIFTEKCLVQEHWIERKLLATMKSTQGN